MKILYIANIRIPTEKAHGAQIINMCEAFAEAGHNLELVIPSRINQIKGNPFEFYDVKQNFKITTLPSPDLTFWGLGGFGFLIQSLIFSAKSIFYVCKYDPDVVYSRDALPAFVISLFRKRGLFFEIHTASNNYIFKKAAQRSAGVVAISGGLKDFCVKTFGLKPEMVLVAHDAVNLEKFKEIPADFKTKSEIRKAFDLPQSKKIITYAGKFKTMGKSKGVEDIVESFSVVLGGNSGAFLLLVGANDDEMPKIKEIYQKLGINEDSGRVVEHVPQKDLFRYLAASDVLVMNYPNIKHYARYMSPPKLFEYMASGRPIVSSDLPSIREVLNEQNSILVKTDDLKSLAEGIKLAVNDEVLSKKLAEQASQDIQNYTWQKRAESIIKFVKAR